MSLTLISAVVAVSFIWLLVLTFLLWRIQTHYNKLTGNINGENLKSVLEAVLKNTSQNKKDVELLKKYCDTIQKEGLLHIQKVGLLRFNPFKDTGGNQSFILSLVDSKNTGVLISGLYSRSGTRLYAKRVVEGKGVDYELSDEEKKALKKE